MAGESTAGLSVKFQLRLTEQEQQMLQELAERQYPETQRAQSMVIRRLIREEWRRMHETPRWNNESFHPRSLKYMEE